MNRRGSVSAASSTGVIDTGRNVETQLNALGAEGWQVVGVTTKKQLLIAPPQAIILMRETERIG